MAQLIDVLARWLWGELRPVPVTVHRRRLWR
jgi:hypothetical protein